MQSSVNNKTPPLFSIITIVYNGGKTLEKTIEHVISQSYLDFEYIIIDGGSTDNSIDIIKKYEKQLSYWVSEKDNGIYDALNKGIAKANGLLVGIINSDDWYEPGAFEAVANCYHTNKDAAVFYGLLRFYSSNNKLMAVQGYTHEYLQYGMISHPTCFVKKEVYNRWGSFDTKYKIAADYHLLLTFKQKGVIFFFIEKILANFKEGGVSTTQVLKINREVLAIKKELGIISKKQYQLQLLLLWFKEKIKDFISA